jgi:hypothetical protein
MIKVNDRLTHPRVIVLDNGDVILEVNSKDLNNKKLHKEVLKGHKKWIEDKLIEKDKLRPNPTNKRYNFVNGTSIYIMGKSYQLNLIDNISIDTSSNIFLDGKNVVVNYSFDECKHRIRELIKEFIVLTYSNYISNKLNFYCSKLGIVNNPKFELKEFKRKLGVCHKDGNISFDWRILMLDSSLIDYVILHELVHLEELNHGKSFHNRLEGVMSNYYSREKELSVVKSVMFNF